MNLEQKINNIWNKADITEQDKNDIMDLYKLVESGDVSIISNIDGQYSVNEWVKRGIILGFKVFAINIELVNDYIVQRDLIPQRFTKLNSNYLTDHAIRIVKTAIVRVGSYIGDNVIIMNSTFVNIGVYIGSNTLVDSNVVLGSCAQIGKKVHIGAGTVIGGVLEPINQAPVIIEDDCFIGANCSIVEGVVIGNGSTIASGINLTASTKIYSTIDDSITYGVIPPHSVVIPGTIPDKSGLYSSNAAIIIKNNDPSTKEKVKNNPLLRVKK